MTIIVKLFNEQQSVDKDKNETSEEIEMEKEIIIIGHMIYHMQCAEHRFQRGIRDALKKGRSEKFLSKICEIAWFLHSLKPTLFRNKE